MAYSTVDQVRSRMAQFSIGTSTKPTTAQVTTFLDEIDSEINVILTGHGIETPVTTPADFVTWLSNVAANGVTALVLKSMFPNTVGPGETPAWAFFEKRYQDALKMLREGGVIPGADSQASTYFTRNPVTEEDLGGISEPLFRIGHSF